MKIILIYIQLFNFTFGPKLGKIVTKLENPGISNLPVNPKSSTFVPFNGVLGSHPVRFGRNISFVKLIWRSPLLRLFD
ncbi:MAG TPA: hypothetical protein DCS30_00690 [Rhizobiales bacterium]|nr:hypothetical protein [Hyphomicrobiales bacterium]